MIASMEGGVDSLVLDCPACDRGCFPMCSPGTGDVLLLLPVNAPNPSQALSAMGFIITGLSPNPGTTEELLPDLLRVWMLSGNVALGVTSPVRPIGNPQPKGVLLSINFNAY